MRKKMFQVRVRRSGFRYSYGFCETLEEVEKKRDKIEARLDKEERSGHIIGLKGEVLKTRFNMNGVWFELTGTESTGKKTMDSLDFIKNTQTKEIKEIPRQVLFDITRDKK